MSALQLSYVLNHVRTSLRPTRNQSLRVVLSSKLLTQLLASSGDIKKSREKREEEEEQAAREEAGKPQG